MDAISTTTRVCLERHNLISWKRGTYHQQKRPPERDSVPCCFAPARTSPSCEVILTVRLCSHFLSISLAGFCCRSTLYTPANSITAKQNPLNMAVPNMREDNQGKTKQKYHQLIPNNTTKAALASVILGIVFSRIAIV
jgi:hypothetical protein